jgi:uncharacterized membrane protein
VLVAAVLGAASIVVFAPAWLRGTTRFVAGYNLAALVLLAFYWLHGLRRNARETQRRAEIEDPGRNVVLTIVLLSCLTGLASAIAILGRGPNVPPNDRSLALGVGLAAVALGWLLIHSAFAFRYAHLYYEDDDGRMRRGLVFPGNHPPDDYDFAYFSFVIGMTFQVSDVQVVDSGVRRLVLLHGVIAFLYNTAILALVINLASGLLSSH